MAEKNYAVLGLGRFGLKVAETVVKTGVTMLVADSDTDKIDSVGGRFASAVSFDMSNVDALREIGLENIDVAVIDLSNDLEGSISCVMVCAECGVERIIATADNHRAGAVLKRLGAGEIIIPEEESALRLAKALISDDFLEYTDMGDGLCIVRLHVKSEWGGKTIRKLKLHEKFDITIIAVQGEDGLTTSFSADQVLNSGDPIALAMKKETLYQFV